MRSSSNIENETQVVWFNHWFSAVVNTIRDMKNTFENIKFIGTNNSGDCTYKHIVDEFYTEPKDLNPEEYVTWALKFCAEHNVNIFFPKKMMKTISKHRDDFEEIGITIICEDFDTIQQFDSKQAVYQKLENLEYDKVPLYKVVHSLAEFTEAYQQFKSKGYTTIIKYDKDEGAASFRVVSDAFLCKESLNETSMNILSFDNACKILEDAERSGRFKPLMVMPKLNGPEVSVDCYFSKGELVAIPRYKLGNRIKQISLNTELIEDCKKLQKIFNFKYMYNVQYRWDENGNPRLLEINPRMSGGIHLTSLSGFNIPNQVLADTLDIDTQQSQDNIKECKVTQFETPIIL